VLDVEQRSGGCGAATGAATATASSSGQPTALRGRRRPMHSTARADAPARSRGAVAVTASQPGGARVTQRITGAPAAICRRHPCRRSARSYGSGCGSRPERRIVFRPGAERAATCAVFAVTPRHAEEALEVETAQPGIEGERGERGR
jgi:hypothetical protein